MEMRKRKKRKIESTKINVHGGYDMYSDTMLRNMTSTKIKEKNLKAWCIDRDDLINSTELIF
jgi:hypothetical protein